MLETTSPDRTGSEAAKRPPIVVGFDASAPGLDALELARVGARELGAKVEVVRVLEVESAWLGVEPELKLLDIEAEADRMSGRRLAGLDYSVNAVNGSPAAVLQDFVEDEGAAVLVLGASHRGSVGRAIFGSVAESLLQGSSTPVAIAPPDYAQRRDNTLSRTIVVGYGGGPDARVAAHAAAELARTTGADLEIVGVMRPFQPSPGRGPDLQLARKRVEDALQEIASEIEGRAQTTAVPLDGEPAQALIDAAARADLLVLGSRSYGPLRRVLLGSTSRAVIHRADCPVLVWPRHTSSRGRLHGRKEDR